MSFLIVGLGNIGVEYANTRHNIGFSVLDAWAKTSDANFNSDRYGSVAEVKFKGKTFVLLKPSTYMNLSGKAVRYWMQELKIDAENVLVVVDDLALTFGTLRMRKKGSDGGHNGLKNITELLGHSNYSRLRLGIGDSFGKGHQIDYVLGKWTEMERKELPFIADKAIDAAKAFGMIGVDKAMSQCNTTVERG